MVDISKIELNPFPLPIIELQEANITLHGKNNILRNVLIGFVVIGGICLAIKALTNLQEKNARNNKGKLPSIKEKEPV